jgi:hypothetical protein
MQMLKLILLEFWRSALNIQMFITIHHIFYSKLRNSGEVESSSAIFVYKVPFIHPKIRDREMIGTFERSPIV